MLLLCIKECECQRQQREESYTQVIRHHTTEQRDSESLGCCASQVRRHIESMAQNEQHPVGSAIACFVRQFEKNNKQLGFTEASSGLRDYVQVVVVVVADDDDGVVAVNAFVAVDAFVVDDAFVVVDAFCCCCR